MAKKLLIVESPAKAKTIGKYLGGEFIVKSSVGHIRDLPKDNNAITITETGDGRWDFKPKYKVAEGKTKVVGDLKTAVKGVDEIYLASDPDREGEAIAWHLKEVLSPVAGDRPFHRVTYNEITESAVLKAISEPRDIDMPRVDAQQARRILDRLVGYKVSPLLWKNIMIANNHTLSAGRVQSVALRLLVERQRAIDAFKPEPYFLIGVESRKSGDDFSFVAKLSRIDGEKPDIRSKSAADNMLLDVAGATLRVTEVKSQSKARHAPPPFTTSSMQQAASSVLGMSPGRTMKVAQELYEHGLITYMRSDSFNVSDQARAMAKDFISAEFGADFYPKKPNVFASKARNGVQAQEAHEAIRPTNVGLKPGDSGLDAANMKLYDLIWRRFLASQMADAKTTLKTIVISAEKTGMSHGYLFTASATEVDFEGFMKVMKLSLKKKSEDGEEDEDSDEVSRLPAVATGDALELVRWVCDEKQTKGPAHYTEASLIKALEENGVGRPSTYAATIETLKVRAYAKTEKRRLIPLERGILVCDWLVANMSGLFNVGYTAEMEAELDKVEEHGEPMNQMLSEFYAKFLASMPAPPAPPDNEKIEAVFGLLAQVKTFKPVKKVGRRIYDDRKFYESCLEQFRQGKRPMSDKQLGFLVKMAVAYSEQIPDCLAKLSAAGLSQSVPAQENAEDGLVRYCFGVMDRIGSLAKNVFLRSLREQFEVRGRGLSAKQFQILAREVGNNCTGLEDCEEIRARLSEFVSEGFEEARGSPVIPALFEMMDNVTKWRPGVVKAKREYDDRQFIGSLREQFKLRNSLSLRQVMALKRLVKSYKDQIPDYDRKIEELELK